MTVLESGQAMQERAAEEKEETGLDAALEKGKRRDWLPHWRKGRAGIGCRIGEREEAGLDATLEKGKSRNWMPH